MIDRSLVLKCKDDVRFRIVGDEAVIIRQDAAEVLAINDVGARILELIDAKKTVGNILSTMLDEYDVATEDLARDIATFVDNMRDAGVVETEPSAS